MTRSVKKPWVSPLPPTARGYTKLEEYFAKMRNGDLEVLATQSDFGVISEVKKAASPIRDRWKSRINNVGNAVESSTYMFT